MADFFALKLNSYIAKNNDIVLLRQQGGAQRPNQFIAGPKSA